MFAAMSLPLSTGLKRNKPELKFYQRRLSADVDIALHA
jgi:hypothetical protein